MHSGRAESQCSASLLCRHASGVELLAYPRTRSSGNCLPTNRLTAPGWPCLAVSADYKGLKDEIKEAAEETRKVRQRRSQDAVVPAAVLRRGSRCVR